MREAPHFRASPAPTEEEAAAIAAALAWLLEQEALAVAALGRAEPGGGALDGWRAVGRGAARRGVAEYRHLLAPGAAWRASGRVPVWGTTTVH